MQPEAKQPVYEVYCFQCNVTFPVGARRCLHCGGRLSRERNLPPLVPTAVVPDEEDGVVEATRRVGVASPMTVVWILLFIGGALYRLCN